MVMSQNVENNKAQLNGLGWLEGLSILGAVGGAIGGAIAMGQSAIMLTALPLSLAAALNFKQRQQMQSAMQAQVEQSRQSFDEVKETTEALAGTDRILMIQLNTTNNRIDEVNETLLYLDTHIETLRGEAAAIAQKQTELMESTLEESYYRRGLELEKRGEFKNAMAAYTEALRVNPNYAQAYMQLGSAFAHAGQKQQAIAHLRTATKLFFESGDLDSYHTARELSESIHAGDMVAEPAVVRLNQPEPSSEPEKNLAVDELFV